MRRLLVAAAVLALAPAAAHATILTFQLNTALPGSDLAMEQTYGDRVTSTLMGNDGYGVGAEGFTPNVVVSYERGGGLTNGMSSYPTDFGDLLNVLQNDVDGDSLLRLTFTADPGYQVTLFGFDMGAWPNSNQNIPGLTVTSGATTLFTTGGAFTVIGSPGNVPRHSVFSFGANGLTAQSLSININLTGLGGASDEVGIDNVRFGQGLTPAAVPEPATWAMMLAGFFSTGTLLRVRRRRTAV